MSERPSQPAESPDARAEKHRSAGAPQAPASPFSREANPRDAEDMVWLSDLIATLADHPVQQEHVVAYFGTDAGRDPENSEYRRISPRSPYFGKVRVAMYSTSSPEDRTKALTVQVTLSAEPARSAVERAAGPLDQAAHMPSRWDPGTEYPWFFGSRRWNRFLKGRYSSLSVSVYQNPQGYHGIQGIEIRAYWTE